MKDKASAEQTARSKAMALLNKRDYSVGELTAKLVEKGFSPEESAGAAERCRELGFINDASYAGIIVRHYAAKGFGARRIKQELQKRYIPKDMWDEALEELPEQEDAAARLLESRLRGADPADRDAVRRASAALVRRGYSWEQIDAALRKLRTGEEE